MSVYRMFQTQQLKYISNFPFPGVIMKVFETRQAMYV